MTGDTNRIRTELGSNFFAVTIRVDGRNLETKPFRAKSKEQAMNMAENNGIANFPNAEEIDAVNVEVMTEEECFRLYPELEDSQ